MERLGVRWRGEGMDHDARLHRGQLLLSHSGRSSVTSVTSRRKCAGSFLVVLLVASHVACSGALLESSTTPFPNPAWKPSFLPGFDPTNLIAPAKAGAIKAGAMFQNTVLAPDMVLPSLPNPAAQVAGLVVAAKNFAVGAVSGWTSSFVMFPVDMAKTRIQDEHIIKGVEPIYKNIFQTIWKVGNEEGVRSIYHGYIPVLLGSAPQGILQVGTNDGVRRFFSARTGKAMDNLDLSSEIIAGSAAGFMQVFATSPMERIKILQQANGQSSGNIIQVIDQIGVKGLFAGASACWMRDIPFCALYFPIYQRTKQWMMHREGHAVNRDGTRTATLWDSLVAGIAASCGISARGCAVSANSVRGTAAELWAEGGMAAFFRGITGRVGRVAPQLAICLAIYDTLTTLFLTEPKT